jgi:hypothetical protein
VRFANWSCSQLFFWLMPEFQIYNLLYGQGLSPLSNAVYFRR